MGLIFGVVEAITPIIGWLIGQAASQFVKDWDHWIAFGLLLILGLHMIYNGLKAPEEEEEKTRQHGFFLLAFINVNILVAAAAIGLATMIMVTIGTLLGRVLGTLAGRRAEIFGGFVLMLVGATILYEHLAVE